MCSGVIVFVTDKSCETISVLQCVRVLLYLSLQVVRDNICIAVCSGVIVFITDKSCETISILQCVRVLLYLSPTSRVRQYLYCSVFGCYCIYH